MSSGSKSPVPTEKKELGHLYKVILIGDPAVGKTTLRKRFMGEPFDPEYLMTIGADFSIYSISLETVPERPTITFQIWDLVGTPHYGTVFSAYYRGANGALIIYDVTRRNTFDNVRLWVNDFVKGNGRGELPYCVIGNKTDLRPEIPVAIQKEEGMDLSEQLAEEITKKDISIDYLETSAKTGQNVDLMFHCLAKNIWDWHQKMKETNKGNK